MAKCDIPLGDFLIEQSGLPKIKGYSDDVDLFLKDLKTVLDGVTVGAVVSTFELPCNDQTSQNELQDGQLLNLLRDDEEPEAPLNSCCAVSGKIVVTGRRKLGLTLQSTSLSFTVKVQVDMAIVPLLVHQRVIGSCNPPASCTNESLDVGIRVRVEGQLTVSAEKTFDLGIFGVVTLDSSKTIKTSGSDIKRCTITCK